MKRPVKRLLIIAALSIAGVAAVAAVVAVRTVTFGDGSPHETGAVVVAPEMEPAELAERLAAALRLATVSTGGAVAADLEPFDAFLAYLEATYPAVHSGLRVERVGGHSLLLTWVGDDATLEPVVLTGHYDVVPARSVAGAEWTHPPFAGVVADGYVWGRGAMDDKSSVLGILEAAEALLADGFNPQRTVLLAFGHDEEVGGRDGARLVAERLAARGVAPAWLLDEGGMVTDGVVPGVTAPVALVNVAEKGFLSLELVARSTGGHSSMPPRETAVGLLGRAVARLEARPLPRRIGPTMAAMLDAIGPEMDLPARALLANRWLFGWAVERVFGASPSGDALLRTTTAPTMLRAGVKDNVLATEARATVNFRLLPGDTVEGVIEHVRQAVDDPRIELRPLRPGSEPPPATDPDGEGFRTVAAAVRATWPEAVVAPGLLVATTDTRHYASLTRQLLRFQPLTVGPEDVARFHGVDERIGIAEYARGVGFYRRLLLGL